MLIVPIRFSTPLEQMGFVPIAAKDILLTAAGRSMADPASKLLINEEATPTPIEVELLQPLTVQVNVRPRTEEDIAGDVPEEAKEITRGKATPMRWMLSPTPSK
jgi:hypothetical protein